VHANPLDEPYLSNEVSRIVLNQGEAAALATADGPGHWRELLRESCGFLSPYIYKTRNMSYYLL
jgi:hypothetical protein